MKTIKLPDGSVIARPHNEEEKRLLNQKVKEGLAVFVPIKNKKKKRATA